LQRSPWIIKAGQRKPKIYFEEWFDPLISGICWVSELIELAGGIDIYKHKQASSLAKDRIIEHANEVVELNPDIIFASWCGKKFKKEQLISRKNWNHINAVKNDFVFEINSSIILQPGPAAVTEGITKIVEIISKWHSFQNS
jgi:iron complex transport system substrate-binding protein